MDKTGMSEAAQAVQRMRDRERRGMALPEWFARDNNAYFCSLMARQIRTRAHMRGQSDAARDLALAIADMIETGDFDWLM